MLVSVPDSIPPMYHGLWLAAVNYCLQSNKSIRRLMHGRGGLYPGLEQVTLDGFDHFLLCVLFKQPDEALNQTLTQLAEVLSSDAGPTLLIQRRYLPGTPYESPIGEVPNQQVVSQNTVDYALKFNAQNTGLFLDMETARAWLAQRAKNKNVLNLFAYTCAFSVVAMANGAKACTNVDMSKSALSWGRENHRINQLNTQCVNFLGVNILKSWSRIKKPGPYDVIVIDPPSFQKGSFVAERDYAKLMRRLPELAADGCEVLLCLNAPELPSSFLHDLCAEHWPGGKFIQRLALPEAFVDVNSERQLKLLHYQQA